MWHSPVFLLGAAASCCIIPYAQAHGLMTQPKPYFKPDTTIDNNYYKLDATKEFPGIKWDDNPKSNVATLNILLKNKKLKKFTNIRALIDAKVPDCGVTLISGAPIDVRSMTEVHWESGNTFDGFTPSHHGPCEVWFDRTLVFDDDDCTATFAGESPAKIPVDFSKCSGKCTLRFYWAAVHEPVWHMYKQCVPIENPRKRSKKLRNKHHGN